MMKKTFKQLLGLTLSAAMVIGMAGCGNDTPTNNTETQVVSKETETTAAKESETQVVEEEGVTYPLTSDESITMWTQRFTLNDDYSHWSESPVHTGVNERIGMNIDYMFPQKGQNVNEAFNLLLTEDVLPDVIHKAVTLQQLQEYYEDGIIYDLTPYLEKYAPDYWSYLTAEGHEEMYRQAATSDGKLLAFWGLRELPSWSITYIGPMIRQDWLDECGLQAPVTLEDWETVLTAFKEKYNATFGFASTYLRYELLASGTGAHATGVVDNSLRAYYVDDDGVVQSSVHQPEWVEYIKIMNRWYENGLIDVDSMTMDANTLRTKAANNQIGASWGPMSQLTNFTTDVEANNSDADWVGISYPRTAPGEPTVSTQYGSPIITSAAFITTSCPEEKLIEVIKALNYGYTEEGMTYFNFGELGVSYTIDSEGKEQWTDLILNDPQGLNSAVTKYTVAHTCPIGIQLNRHGQMKNSDAAVAAVDAWVENTKVQEHYLLVMELTEEEQAVYTDKYVAIATYINEMTQKYIMGVEDIDNVDAFYAQLEKMGMQECLEIQRAAYARYLTK